tara:strand:+ start:1946 stop:2545 length:600 start_codon:yes stop_codon:yes gene_type:complete
MEEEKQAPASTEPPASAEMPAEAPQAEAVEAQPVEAVSVEEPVQAVVQDVQEQKKEEVTPEKASSEAVNEANEAQHVLHQEMVNRLGMLESKIKDYEQKEQARQATIEQEKVAARGKLLKELGIIDDLYGRLAPSIEDADPRTEEGQEAYRQWMVKHPNLFKKAPTLEKISNATKESERIGNTFRKHLTFSEAIRKIKG